MFSAKLVEKIDVEAGVGLIVVVWAVKDEDCNIPEDIPSELLRINEDINVDTEKLFREVHDNRLFL